MMRFYRSKEMFFNVYKDLVDYWEIYYNSNEIFEKVADAMSVYDHEKMKEFRSISNDTKN